MKITMKYLSMRKIQTRMPTRVVTAVESMCQGGAAHILRTYSGKPISIPTPFLQAKSRAVTLMRCLQMICIEKWESKGQKGCADLRGIGGRIAFLAWKSRAT